MTSVVARIAFVVACLLVLDTPAIAQDEEAGTPCAQAISCDCENIEAGLLTGPWKDDCRSCQAGMIERCDAAYPPLGNGLAAAGYCENACSVTGPNPTPKAPPPMSEGEVPEGVFGAAPMLLSCPLNMKLSTISVDGMDAQGCLDEAGLKQGLFVFVDEATNEVVEILFADDVEVDRTRRPRA
jgi:hypothetical protein